MVMMDQKVKKVRLDQQATLDQQVLQEVKAVRDKRVK